MSNARKLLAIARAERVKKLADRPDGVSAPEAAEAIGMDGRSVLDVIGRAKLAYGLVRVHRHGTRGWRWFSDAEQARAWAARPDCSRYSKPAAGPAAAGARHRVPPPDRSRIDVPPVPGWGGPPARRAGADDWRLCGNVMLGRHRPGATR